MSDYQKTGEVVNALFERLIAINPAFKQAWPTDASLQATKKEWIIAFMEVGIDSISRLKKGLAKCRLSTSPFIPSIGEFISWCNVTPDDVGAPDVETAYRQACKNSQFYETEKVWSHEAVRYAFNHVGSYNLSNKTRQQTYPAFVDAYQDACELFSKGMLKASLPPPGEEIRPEMGKHTKGKYKFAREGVLEQYEHIASKGDAMKAASGIPGGRDMLRGLLKSLGGKPASS